ncbi:unnamed protein product [Closterium sp. Naga37s-1]|nr:unnamed protein product [Closterium sp. Naga37s-1]
MRTHEQRRFGIAVVVPPQRIAFAKAGRRREEEGVTGERRCGGPAPCFLPIPVFPPSPCFSLPRDSSFPALSLLPRVSPFPVFPPSPCFLIPRVFSPSPCFLLPRAFSRSPFSRSPCFLRIPEFPPSPCFLPIPVIPPSPCFPLPRDSPFPLLSLLPRDSPFPVLSPCFLLLPTPISSPLNSPHAPPSFTPRFPLFPRTSPPSSLPLPRCSALLPVHRIMRAFQAEERKMVKKVLELHKAKEKSASNVPAETAQLR